ncbi:MAG: hypothetical protein M3Y24_11065 [Acidobacteriota bacterium]|nr:hypothetical protein [Acidobacteriota bacterium]
MATPVATGKLPVIPVAVGFVVVVAAIAGALYLHKPVRTAPEGGATSEAKAYLVQLQLSGVNMQATENFMKQQVIEVTGKITDNGPRALRTVDVYCLFYGVNGQEIHRERLPILKPGGASLAPGETRPFRLPFDAVPDGWNQALPKMVIAQITFAR